MFDAVREPVVVPDRVPLDVAVFEGVRPAVFVGESEPDPEPVPVPVVVRVAVPDTVAAAELV